MTAVNQRRPTRPTTRALLAALVILIGAWLSIGGPTATAFTSASDAEQGGRHAGPSIVISGPRQGERWLVGSTQTIRWTVSPAQSRGEFRVWLLGSDGTWHQLGQPDPVPGQVSYSFAFTVRVPPASGYRAVVYWRPLAGSGTWVATAKSDTFTIADRLTVTQPTEDSSWPPGTVQNVTWSIDPAVDRGEFHVWLVSPEGTWHFLKAVSAVDAQTAYLLPVTIKVPAAEGYQAAVYWRPNVGSGSWEMKAKSPAFPVCPITVISPRASTIWRTEDPHVVEWSISPAVSSGRFLVALLRKDGTSVAETPVNAVGNRTAYEASFAEAVSPGTGYRVTVSWQGTPESGTWDVTSRTRPFVVAPTLSVISPTASSAWPTQSDQIIRWSTSAAVEEGEFRVYIGRQEGAVYLDATRPAAPGQTSYEQPVSLDLPPASGYRAHVSWRPVPGRGTWMSVCESDEFTIEPLIDVASPVPMALAGSWTTAIKQGATLDIPYRVKDAAPSTGLVRVTIGFYRVPPDGPAIHLFDKRVSGLKKTGVRYYYRFKCTLAGGKNRYYLYMIKATDQAGHDSATSLAYRDPLFKRICRQLKVAK